MLKEGQEAPDFTLKDDQGNSVSLADFAGRKFVLYFYPKDFTAGWYEIERDFSQYIVNGTSAGSLRPDANYASGACTSGTGDFSC